MSGNHGSNKLEDRILTTKQLPELDTKVESWRCVNCTRFLGYVAIIEGTVAIKCKKCKTWNILDVQRDISQEIVDNKESLVYSDEKVD